MKDKYGIKYKYPDRSCEQCSYNPCFIGKEKCVSKFAAYGCEYYKPHDHTS